MKKYKIILLSFIAAVFLLTAFKQNRKTRIFTTGKWSGVVSFHEKRISDGFNSEWRMNATIVNDTGTVIQTYTFGGKRASGHCMKDNKTALEVGIDEERKLYSIFVPVEGCRGTQTTYDGVTSDFGLTDETGIMINDQPLSTNHNVLSGTFVIKGDANEPLSVTTYTWSLKKN